MPVSAVERWVDCTEGGILLGESGVQDDYDRACEVAGLAEIVAVGDGASGLVLADEPAATCYLADRRAFVRWLAADSEAELIEGATAVLDDPATDWEDCGIWDTDGPVVLMDSAVAGRDLAVEYPGSGGLPEQAHVPLSAGRWRVRAVHTTGESPWVGVVQLLRRARAADPVLIAARRPRPVTCDERTRAANGRATNGRGTRGPRLDP